MAQISSRRCSDGQAGMPVYFTPWRTIQNSSCGFHAPTLRGRYGGLRHRRPHLGGAVALAGLLLAAVAALAGAEAGAEPVHAGEGLVAGLMVDGTLGTELRSHPHPP